MNGDGTVTRGLEVPARFRFRYDVDYLMTAYDRYRQIHWSRHLPRVVTVLGVLVATGFAASSLRDGQWSGAILGVLIVFVLFTSRNLGRELMRRRLTRMSGTAQSFLIALDEDGMLAEGGGARAELGWDTFRDATCFDDGVLLVQGPRVFNWLPWAALEGDVGRDAVVDLLRRHLARVSRLQ